MNQLSQLAGAKGYVYHDKMTGWLSIQSRREAYVDGSAVDPSKYDTTKTEQGTLSQLSLMMIILLCLKEGLKIVLNTLLR